ncbi:hypothetical protein CL656_02515 [bacterium]|nr:hypothetical protein [bacterium]|tara:strand:- start:691 stop:2724 length:2034 start_codon:yes stop_codon:yes gene_type:complete
MSIYNKYGFGDRLVPSGSSPKKEEKPTEPIVPKFEKEDTSYEEKPTEPIAPKIEEEDISLENILTEPMAMLEHEIDSENVFSLPITDEGQRAIQPTDFTPKLDVTKGDLSFIPKYFYPLVANVLKDPFLDTKIHSLSPTDFNQDRFGNCWEVACLKAILDKPWGILIVQDVLRRVEYFTWEFKRPTRDVSESPEIFDIRNTFYERLYKSEGALFNSLFLNARHQYYVYFIYGLLKAMDPFIRSNRERYDCPSEVSKKDTMEIADGFYSVSVLFFLFKNIANDLGRMQFTLSSYGSYKKYKKGELTYSELRDRDFRVYELLEISKEFEFAPDNYICIVSFFEDYHVSDTITLKSIKIRTEHAYYWKSFSSKLDMVTLVDPNCKSAQIHLSFSSFISRLCAVEYAYFKDRYSDFNPRSFVRNTPLSVVEKKEVDRNCSEVNAREDSWLDFNPSMIISTEISDYNILFVEGKYRLYDRTSGKLLSLLSCSDACYDDSSVSNPDEPIKIVFDNIFDVPYDFIRSYCHVLAGETPAVRYSFRLDVSKGYLILNSPVDAVCIYPDLIPNSKEGALRVPYDYKKLIKPIFIRFFRSEDFGEIVIYQMAPHRNIFNFVVNGLEFKCSRNMFETKKFFNLKHKVFFEPSILTDKNEEGFYVSMEHNSYTDINFLIEFKNITTQFFN